MSTQGVTTPAGQDEPVTLVPVAHGDVDWLFVKSLLRSCPSAQLVGLQRVHWPLLWDEFVGFRDRYLGESANEQFLFHGTGPCSTTELFAHPFGLDPRFSAGGFYGKGIYLAEEASYPIGGRFAHRVAGSGGKRLQLLLVRANLGRQQELGQRIDSTTRAMQIPDMRPAEHERFHSVRAGPHRPFLAGTGESSLDASMVHVLYESRQLYPQYVLEIEVDLAPETVSALASAATEETPSKSNTRSSPGVRHNSKSSTYPTPPGPPLKHARLVWPFGAPGCAAVHIAPAGDLEELVAALVREGPPADKTVAASALRTLLRQGGEAAKAWVPATGVLEALVVLVREGSPDGKAAAAGALCCLSYKHPRRKEAIAAVADDLFEALVALVRDGLPEGKAAAAGLLCTLTDSHEERKVAVATAGGLEALVALVRSGSPEGKAAAVNALCFLASKHVGRCASIVAAGGLEAVEALARDGPPDGKAAAAAAIALRILGQPYEYV